MDDLFYSVRWYEPLLPRHDGKSDTITVVDGANKVQILTLPSGRGWHEQTLTSATYACNLERALSRKGYNLIEHRCYRVINGLRIDQ